MCAYLGPGFVPIDPEFLKTGPQVSIANTIDVTYKVDTRDEKELPGRKRGDKRVWKIIARGIFSSAMKLS